MYFGKEVKMLTIHIIILANLSRVLVTSLYVAPGSNHNTAAELLIHHIQDLKRFVQLIGWLVGWLVY